MPIVTDVLIAQLRRQVETHGTVIWFDPHGMYASLAEQLGPEALSTATIYRYDPARGFVWLRHELEALWSGRTDPPRLLIYVPLSQANTGNALIEYQVAGVVLAPGKQPPEHNTALDAVARRALSDIVPAAKLAEIVAQVEAGKLSLADLDSLAENEDLIGVIGAIFGTGHARDVAICFLADPSVDERVQARQATGDLAKLLSDTLGIDFAATEGLDALRASVARQVLVTDLIEALGDQAPQALDTFATASSPVARQAAVEIAQTWRMRRDLAQSYVRWAEQVQAAISLASLGLDPDALSRSETFAAGETLLQEHVEKGLGERTSRSHVQLAEKRLRGFWSAQLPEVKTRWEVIAVAGRVLLAARRVGNALKGKSWPAGALLSGYAYGDDPWYALDMAQRRLERDVHNLDIDPARHQALLQLVARARQHYADVSGRLAELWTKAYAADGFDISGVAYQADVYHDVVAPLVEEGPVAYMLVDALRYEMAGELSTVLEPDWEHELHPALATPPTTTEVGMAALLPGAERGVAVVESGGKLAASVAGQSLRTRQDRITYLQETVPQPLAVVRLDKLAPLTSHQLGNTLREARLVVVTATEQIDGLCESNPVLARRMLDDVLKQLRRGIKTLFGLGVRSVVITADHGYLFGQELSAGQKIDAPGGETLTLKRRVWVGKGGAELPGTLRRPLSALGIGGEYEMVTPLDLSCFKAPGGATEYFHGGLSLPELVVPVLTVRPGTVTAPAAGAPVQWTLTLGSHTISTRFMSVTVEGVSTQLLPLTPPAVRLEVRADGQVISVPVSASYGFQEATKDVQLSLGEAGPPQSVAKNTITLMITDEPDVSQVSIHMLDATTGISMARLDGIPFAIAL